MIKGAIVIPTLNEGAALENALTRLQSLMDHWLVVVADGGSEDNTQNIAHAFRCELVIAPRGRASQMNEGAFKARQRLGVSGLLVFLHADTLLPQNFDANINRFIEAQACWGFFPVNLSGTQSSLRLIETMINKRSRFTRIATGDQTLVFTSEFFWMLRGFPMLSLMEDVEMSVRAKAVSTPFVFDEPVITSSRKWEREGIWKTVFFMWFCRAAYYFGVTAATIHRWYYGRKP